MVERAAPDTLLGALQRGLGRGFLGALEARAASEVLACVLDDPRWDRQLERRASYYGQLGVLLRIDVAPIAAALRADGERGQGALAADVLAHMAWRGDERALDALRGELDHEGWLHVLEAVDEVQAPLVDPLEYITRRSDEELEAAVAQTAALPWQRWATSMPRLERWLPAPSDPEVSRPPAAKADTSMSTEELLRIAEPRNRKRILNVLDRRNDAASVAALEAAAQGSEAEARFTAYRALTARGHAALLPVVVAELNDVVPPAERSPERRRLRALMRHYLLGMPGAQTMPLAREWFDGRPHLAVIAERIYARHAEAADRSFVEKTLRECLAREENYRACSMVEALTRIGDVRSSNTLVQAFESITYAWARPRVLEALAACASPALGQLAQEALWDCEFDVRLFAGRHANVRENHVRLVEMRDDIYEYIEVRDAARAHLEAATSAL